MLFAFFTIRRRTKWRVVSIVLEREMIHLFSPLKIMKKVLLTWNSGSSKRKTNAWLILYSFTVDVRHENKNWRLRTTVFRSFQNWLPARSKLKGFTKWLFSHISSCFSVREHLSNSMKISLSLFICSRCSSNCNFWNRYHHSAICMPIISFTDLYASLMSVMILAMNF